MSGKGLGRFRHFRQVEQHMQEILGAFKVGGGWRVAVPDVLGQGGCYCHMKRRAYHHEPKLARGILMLGLETLLRRKINHNGTLRKGLENVNSLV